MNPFKHVRSGEPLVIHASAYNAMLDAGQAVRNRRLNLTKQGTGFDSLFVHVVNSTGKHLERFSVVGLNGPLVTDFTESEDAFCERIVFNGAVPTREHKGKFAVLQEDAEPDQCVRACVSGATIAKIQEISASQGEIRFCCVKENETGYLVAGDDGAEVLWCDSHSQNPWAIIRIGGIATGAAPVTELSGVVMEAIAPGRTGRVKLYGKTYPDTDKDGNAIEPVYDLIICDELAGAQNEFPEQLLPGVVLHDIRGPFRRKKESSEENDSNSETETYYVAVNTEGVYTGIPATDVTGPDAESTVQIRDCNGNLTTMTIHSYYLGEYQRIESGTGVMVARQQTESGLRLVIIKSRSAIKDSEVPQ